MPILPGPVSVFAAFRLRLPRRLALVLCLGFFASGESVAGGTSSEAPPRSGLDVIFVIDNSGSMKKSDPEFLTRSVVRDFSSMLAADPRFDAHVAMVLFDEDARLLGKLVAPGEGGAALAQALERVDFGGQRTNSPAGIERALYELSRGGREESQKAIIFLTDGVIDTGDPKRDQDGALWLLEELAQESKQSGIKIFGIAFTDRADFQLIQTLALKTGGHYYRAFSIEELESVFGHILDAMRQVPLPPSSTEPATTRAAAPATLPPVASSKPTTGIDKRALLPIAVLLMGAAAFVWRQSRREATPAAMPKAPVAAAVASPKGVVPPAQLIDRSKATSSDPLPILLQTERTSIGRDDHNEIVISDSTVSSSHATVEYHDGYFWLTDRRSTNGTKLNGDPLAANEPVQLKGGDVLHFANFGFQFVIPDFIPSGETVFLSSTTGGIRARDPGRAMSEAAEFARAQPARQVEDVDESPVIFPETDLGHDSTAPIETDRSVPKTQDESSTKSEEDARLAAVADENDFALLRECLDAHLTRVRKLGPAYERFVDQSFGEDIREALSASARDLMAEAIAGNVSRTREYASEGVLYVLCVLPDSMENAVSRFVDELGGFSNLVTRTLHSELFLKPACDVLCVITYGRRKDPWLSMTIATAPANPDPIELLSYEFLSSAEREKLIPGHGAPS